MPMDGSIVFEAQWNAFGEVGPWGAVDPVSGVIFWLFTGRQCGAAGSGTYDHFAVCYHPDSGRWSTADGFTGPAKAGPGFRSRDCLSRGREPILSPDRAGGVEICLASIGAGVGTGKSERRDWGLCGGSRCGRGRSEPGR